MDEDDKKILRDIKDAQVATELAAERIEEKTDRSLNLFIAAAKKIEDSQLKTSREIEVLCGRVGRVTHKVNVALALSAAALIAVVVVYFIIF